MNKFMLKSSLALEGAITKAQGMGLVKGPYREKDLFRRLASNGPDVVKGLKALADAFCDAFCKAASVKRSRIEWWFCGVPGVEDALAVPSIALCERYCDKCSKEHAAAIMLLPVAATWMEVVGKTMARAARAQASQN